MTEIVEQTARHDLAAWYKEIHANSYVHDLDFIHSVQFYFPQEFQKIDAHLKAYGEEIANQLESLVNENNQSTNLPRLQEYSSFGVRIDKIIHHPTYLQSGEIIYRTGLLEKMSQPGGLSNCLAILFLSSQVGEGGHHCPIACSAGMIRVLQRIEDFPNKSVYLEKLMSPFFQTNFTGAQFLTEIQGGSDVGLNEVRAVKNTDSIWKIRGDKWFCSNAGADLIFVTARYDDNIKGTKGLGLFLVPAEWEGEKNRYVINRLKEKIGTRTMATGEITFQDAYAIAMGPVENGFQLAMDNVLHLSRLFNSFCVLGMARRAYQIARSYARHRVAFSKAIIHYPLVQENLAILKCENNAMLAAMFSISQLQDQLDKNNHENKKEQLLLRLLVNIQKYLTSLWSLRHIHHAIDVLAGNGMIETFSPLPRLLRDALVCENWEGTHNVLQIQVYKDILKYEVDIIFLEHIKSEMEKLSNSPHKEKLIDEFQLLEKEIQHFRNTDSEIQLLQIRHVVNRMAMLYCALRLLFEALDQVKLGNSSKIVCYDYFILLHFQPHSHNDNKNYLNLISHIIHA